MILKDRTESTQLKILRCLNIRMNLSNKEKLYYSNLERGYEGELKFDQMTQTLQGERYFLNDLLFEVNSSYFQIDSLMISQRGIHLIDIKNFQGDCYLDKDKLYNVQSKREYKNPLDQLKRSATLFHQLLSSLHFHYVTDSSVIFINPEFTLYQAPMDQPFILPSQINRFLNDINQTPSKLNDQHNKLAQTLLSLHNTKNPFAILPKYDYSQLQKGIYCTHCKSFSIDLCSRHSLTCKSCGCSEKIENAILRNVEELKLLFPNLKITTQLVSNWCQTKLNQRTFRRILKRNYTAVGRTCDTFYK